jgi:hypothetical protein
MLRRWVFIFSVPVLICANTFAAKVIMKDGKIYQGRIVAETDGDVLIRTSPVSRSKLLLSEDILTVVRDPIIHKNDPQRYSSVDVGLLGNIYSTRGIELNPSASLRLGGGLRFHPLMEIAAGLEWSPHITGELGVTDGTITRIYEKFYSYSGGLSTKWYPFFKKVDWRVEPFLILGYEWRRFVPKDSGDALKGSGINTGLGAYWQLNKRLFLETRFLYQRMRYGNIFFQLREGTLDPAIRADNFTLSTHLSLRF